MVSNQQEHNLGHISNHTKGNSRLKKLGSRNKTSSRSFLTLSIATTRPGRYDPILG